MRTGLFSQGREKYLVMLKAEGRFQATADNKAVAQRRTRLAAANKLFVAARLQHTAAQENAARAVLFFNAVVVVVAEAELSNSPAGAQAQRTSEDVAAAQKKGGPGRATNSSPCLKNKLFNPFCLACFGVFYIDRNVFLHIKNVFYMQLSSCWQKRKSNYLTQAAVAQVIEAERQARVAVENEELAELRTQMVAAKILLGRIVRKHCSSGDGRVRVKQ